MDSVFAAAWRDASPAIDAVFGTLFRYQPMMPGPSGGRPVPDPSRPVTEITGALTERPVDAYPETRGRRASVVAQEATSDSSIDIANMALPFAPKNGDRLVSLATGAVYEVNGPEPDGIARTQLRVVLLKSGTS